MSASEDPSPPSVAHPPPDAGPSRARALEVLWAFLKLGLTSFGGPVAHLGYFRTEFVERRRWLDDRSYADLVALCQFLPGPASSQVGMALGLQRAGGLGALMAWVGFTLPSALALIVFAYGMTQYGAWATSGAVQGLKVVAVAVVAQAVWGMARSLCPDGPRVALALGAALLCLAWPGSLGQLAALAACGLLGWRLLTLPADSPTPHIGYGVSRRVGAAALGLFAALLLGLPLVALATGSPVWAMVEGFYRAGALVFGGGHVVLPLLQTVVVPSGAVTSTEFLAGYGAAQAVPGPLFTFAAYLGAVMDGPLTGALGGLVFLGVIFLPAFLLVVGALPFWDALRVRPSVRTAMAGVNAGVVGLLLAALVGPVRASGLHDAVDLGLAVAAFVLLVVGRVSPLLVVGLGALTGAALR
jgi:chromate transporter